MSVIKPKKFSRNKVSNVILIGATGVGKTSVGEELAKLIGFGFLDVDAAIEQMQGKKITEIFNEGGEAYFRDLESRFLAGVQGILNHVIAVGAGALASEENLSLLKKMGYIIWLQADAAEVVRRLVMKPDELRARPLLAEAVLIEDRAEREKFLTKTMENYLKLRSKGYEQADQVLVTHYSTAQTTAHLVKNSLAELVGEV
jgi:shikimate kinase